MPDVILSYSANVQPYSSLPPRSPSIGNTLADSRVALLRTTLRAADWNIPEIYLTAHRKRVRSPSVSPWRLRTILVAIPGLPRPGEHFWHGAAAAHGRCRVWPIFLWAGYVSAQPSPRRLAPLSSFCLTRR